MTFFYEGVSFFDTAVLIFFLLFVWSLIYRNPAFMIIAIMFVNVALSAMSFYLIELGGYITELGNWSYRTGNLPLHVFYNTLFVSSFFLAYRASGVSNGHLGCQRSQNRLFSLANRLIVFLLVAVIATEYISLFFYGVAIVDGINKVDYAIINPVVGFFGSTATYVSVFLGGLYFHSYKKFYLGIYLAHFLFLILSAQKFSALIVNLSFFFSLYLIRKQYFRMSGKLLYGIILLSITILAVFYFAYSQSNSFSDELGLSVSGAMAYRALYLSAHAQWASLIVFFQSGGELIGLVDLVEFNKYIVTLLHPQDTFDSLEKGVTFGMVFPAYNILGVPVILHIPLVLFQGGLIGLMLSIFTKWMSSGKLIGACILSVFLNILIRIFITGDLSQFFSFQSIFVYFSLVMYVLIRWALASGRVVD